MNDRITSILASVGNNLCNLVKTQPTISPHPTPPAIIHKNCNEAFETSKFPETTATIANCIIMSEEASFNKLSPSKMVETHLGRCTNLVMALALTASGGETIPPNKKPNASVKPGINQYVKNATLMAVIKTTMKAKLRIILRHLKSSLNEQDQAASYKMGGKKRIKTMSGSS